VLSADGDAVLASTTVDANAGLAVVALGPDAVAVGGRTTDLLRSLDPAAQQVTHVCTNVEPPGAFVRGSSLSAAGSALALVAERGIWVVRTSDGAHLLEWTDPASDPVWSAQLAPDGAYVIVRTVGYPQQPARVLRVSDGVEVADVEPEQTGWAVFAFAPDGRHLYTTGDRGGGFRLDILDLVAGGAPVQRPLPASTMILGFEDGCPVLYDGTRGAYQSCPAGDGAGTGPGAPSVDALDLSGAMLSPDGRFVAQRDDFTAAVHGGVSVERMPPGAPPLARYFPQRSDETVWEANEFPVALPAGGARLVSGAFPGLGGCYIGPSFEVLVRDVATGALLDRLPPNPSSSDARGARLAYAGQLWCAP
jgi:hypothetical protein